MATAAASKKVQYNTENLFILFYTLRVLWKLKKGHKVPDLYGIVFPSKSGGNKTLYDHILGFQKCKILEHSKRLSGLTGIDEQYLTGEYRMRISTVKDDDWSRFIKLRKDHGDSLKAAELKQVEAKINKAIGAANEKQEKEKPQFQRLAYFAEYGLKKPNKTLGDLFREIEAKIAECEPKKFENADISLLESHQQVIREHLDHIAATIIMAKWKK